MKQALLDDNGFKIRDVEMPKAGPNDVLIRVVANGVCASDIGQYKDRDGRRGKEITLGHEASGEVVTLGTDVKDFKVGDMVTALAGVYADYTICEASGIVKLDTTVDPTWALGEPVACCVHAMDRSRIEPGMRVAVVGSGFMGLLCLQLAKAAGAGEITAIDVMSKRLEMAKSLGAAKAVNAKDYDTDKMPDFDGEYDVVIEAVGNQVALDLSGYLVKQHGLINLVGHHYTNSGKRTVYMNQWNVKAIDVVNGHVRRNDEKLKAMRKGMELISQGKLEIKSLVHFYPMSKIQEAFDDSVAGRDEIVKVVIIPEC